MMTCTHTATTDNTLAEFPTTRVVFRGDGYTVIIVSARRGGCLYAGSMTLRDCEPGADGCMRDTVHIGTTGMYDHLAVGDSGTTGAYLHSLCEKHLARG